MKLEPMKLERPNVKYKTSFIAAVREFRVNGNGLEDLRELELVDLENDFEAYVQSRFRWENPAMLEPGKVLQSEFWLVDNLEYIGRAKLRHELNDHLRVFGGHIGYEIRPSRQRQGLGTLMLKLVLEKARAIGLKRVLITCDVENLGSRGVIEANGGVLVERFTKPSQFDNTPGLRYRIALSA